MKIKTGLNQWSDIGSFKGKVGGEWLDVTHVKSAGQWFPLNATVPEDKTLVLALSGVQGDINYLLSPYVNGVSKFFALFYDAQDQLLLEHVVNAVYDNVVTAPAGSTKVVLYDNVELAASREVSSPLVTSVTKWFSRPNGYNNLQRFKDCINLTTVPAEAPLATSLSTMFSGCTNFNQDLSGWDVSNVTNMNNMFRGCTYFNQNLSGWDVSRVTNVTNMFQNCRAFNQDLSGWNVSNVTNMNNMFSGCVYFNYDISGWDTSNVTNMSNMFYGCRTFNQDLSGWDTSNVTNLTSMFNGCSAFNGDISTWDVSKVTTMSWLFYGCTKFNQDISGWDVSSLTNMNWMFRGCVYFNYDISGWNVGNVTNMNNMLQGCTYFNQNLSGWCVSKITTLPVDFVAAAPLMTTEKLPVWGTCPVR